MFKIVLCLLCLLFLIAGCLLYIGYRLWKGQKDWEAEFKNYGE